MVASDFTAPGEGGIPRFLAGLTWWVVSTIAATGWELSAPAREAIGGYITTAWNNGVADLRQRAANVQILAREMTGALMADIDPVPGEKVAEKLRGKVNNDALEGDLPRENIDEIDKAAREASSQVDRASREGATEAAEAAVKGIEELGRLRDKAQDAVRSNPNARDPEEAIEQIDIVIRAAQRGLLQKAGFPGL
jgi:hypothetical protein